MIRGSADRFEGSYVTGWAIASPDDHACVIEVLDGEDRVVGSGRATRSRQDLLALGHGRSNFAFRIPVQELGSTGKLRVRADGEELPGSPITVGAGLFDGFFNLSRGYLNGWVTERQENFAPPEITVMDQDDAVIVRAQAVIDSSAGDPFYAPARFRFMLPPACFGRPALRLRVLADGVAFASPASCALRLLGFLDNVSPDRCAGWLLSPDAPDRRFELEVLRNGKIVGTGICNLPREDLRATHPQAWQVGFEIGLRPPDRSQARVSTLSVRLARSEVELFDGPFVVGRRAAMVAAAHRAARLSHDPSVPLDTADRAVLQLALSEFAESRRRGNDHHLLKQADRALRHDSPRRLNVLIPIYADVAITRACIASVLRHRSAQHDGVVLVNDSSPDPEMAPMLRQFAREPRVHLLTNEKNLGFVQSVNRGLEFCQSGDVVLLNSDTQFFAGGLDELWRVANSAPDIATATAISNNATIFSYPHPSTPVTALDDVPWDELAAVALRENAELRIEVPTAHGFCMLIRREILDRLHKLNESFGRGYGEENELCLRASDLGYRHVIAAGVFVEHRESVSFGAEKEALLRRNMAKLEGMYPEYNATIHECAEQDELRLARLPLDRYRLGKARTAGIGFALVVESWLGGGTVKAIADIESEVGYGEMVKLRLSCNEAGQVSLQSANPLLHETFPADDTAALFELLDSARIDLVLVHQLLGFSADFVARLGAFVEGRRSVFYAHDFFSICPRVNLIDAIGQFCGGADSGRCARCIGLGGMHEASRMTELDPAEHRLLFGGFLDRVRHVVVPSDDTGRQLARIFAGLKTQTIPHLHLDGPFPPAAREGSDTDIVLLGAIGPHKGSAKLLEIARHARMNHPALQFHVIGYTDIDRQLTTVGNVTITGKYQPAELPQLIAKSGARLALFLHGWPETFSYTLSEAVANGLIPLVPDLGAPAERVRAAGFGVVFPFPVDAGQVLDAITGVADGRIAPQREGGSPEGYATPNSASDIAAVLGTVRKPPDAEVVEIVEIVEIAEIAASPAGPRRSRRGLTRARAK